MTRDSSPYVILVALQFDETGERALEQAVSLATRSGSSMLHVVHVVGSSVVEDLRGNVTALFTKRWDEAPAELERRLDRACQGTSLRVHAHIHTGDPAAAILQSAVDEQVDLIVLGSHRRRGLEKWMLGSVGERVLHGAPCPVFIAVPKAEASAVGAPAPSSGDCPDCLGQRAHPGGGLWCERHARPSTRTHRYSPQTRRRASWFGA